MPTFVPQATRQSSSTCRRSNRLPVMSLVFFFAACSGLQAQTPAPLSIVGPIQIRIDGYANYSALVNGASPRVEWSVNGFPGGEASYGTISSSGVYSPGHQIYAGHSVTISAATVSMPVSSASLNVKVLNQLPTLTSGSVTQTAPGTNFLLDAHGSAFVVGSQLLVAGTDVATIFISSTELKSTISLPAGTATVSVGVLNPNAAQKTPVSRTLRVQIAYPLAALSAFFCSNASVMGSGSDRCTVMLTAAAASGGQSVSLASSNAAVSVPATVTVPANATSTGVTASVSSVKSAQGVTLTATSVGFSKSFALQLNAAVPTLSVSSTSLAFGNVTVNIASTQPVTLASVGSMPVVISSGTLSGPGFMISGATFPVTLNPGLAVTLDVQFEPTVTGAASGRLIITDNSVNNGTAIIGLTGIGTAAPPVAVTVNPTNDSIVLGADVQFAATVTGTSNTAVGWTVSGKGCSGIGCGTISSNGLYSAPTVVSSSANVTVTATSVSDPTQSGSAAITIVPPQAAGYDLAWEDTFSTISLCTTDTAGCNWYYPGLYNFGATGAVTDPTNTYVNLNWVTSEIYTTNISTCAMNGIYCKGWTFGYFEASMAFNNVTGNWPAVWLQALNYNKYSTHTGPEIDIFEWQSNTSTVGFSTLHTWLNGTDLGTNSGSNTWSLSGATLSNYNTYGVLWTPTAIAFYFNNSLVETVNTTVSPYNREFNGQYPVFLALSEQAGCNFVLYQVTPCSGQVSPLNMQVQWVHVYQTTAN
jgi:Glycosyl hydrolases family 16/Abnormal spindle-like microcephaly-assoc'd, ASPM-SPD-2-Hydin